MPEHLVFNAASRDTIVAVAMIATPHFLQKSVSSDSDRPRLSCRQQKTFQRWMHVEKFYYPHRLFEQPLVRVGVLNRELTNHPPTHVVPETVGDRT